MLITLLEPSPKLLTMLTGVIIKTTQDANYSTGVVIQTNQHANYSTGASIKTTECANDSNGASIKLLTMLIIPL